MLHCYNALPKCLLCVVFNFPETFPTRNSRNKSHAKFKAFTVGDKSQTVPETGVITLLLNYMFCLSEQVSSCTKYLLLNHS